MVDATLKNYIKTTLKQGYQVGAIKKRLLQSGYSQSEVDLAVRSVRGRKIISAKTIAVVVIVAILLIILTIFILKILSTEPKDIYISTTPLVSSVAPGGKLTFVNTLTSSTSREVNAELKHNIIYKKTGKTIGTKTERLSVGAKSSTQTSTNLPADLELGEYEVITIMRHKEGTKQSSFNFIVQEGPQLQEPRFEEPSADVSPLCPTGCDDYNACTSDRCLEGICENTAIIPCCGNGKCESGEDQYSCSLDCGSKTETTSSTVNNAIKKARTDPSTATMLCNSLPSVTDADDCFNTLAEKTNKHEFCESIQEDQIQSDCLMDFALAGNYEVCDKINDPYYLQSCFTLERQVGLQGMAAQFS